MSNDISRRFETTLIILKPDAVQRRLIGMILSRFEQKGLQIAGLKMTTIPRAVIEDHYGEHRGKDFYEPLVNYMSDRPLILLALRGKDAVRIVRTLVGATFGSQADPGTIRGDLAISNRFNLIHASDAPETAEKELALFFKPGELLEYEFTDLGWLYDMSTGDVV